jgi:integrase
MRVASVQIAYANHHCGSLSALKSLVLDTVSAPASKRAYGAALDDFLTWYSAEPRPGFTKATVTAFRAHLESRGLSSATINVKLAAVRKLAGEAADNGLLAPEIAGGIARVKGARRLGVRTGNWLTLDQAEQFIASPDPGTLKGKRDRALLGVLIGCGLRRKELANLDYECIQLREARWIIADLTGKGGRVRTVPMPAWAKAMLDVWTAAAGVVGGRVFRAINKGDRISGESMTPQSVFETVKHYADLAGVTAAPHDLRRTFAKLAHKGHAALEQIQLSLGHASIQTTERYLGVRLDLTDAPCDRLGIRVAVTDLNEPAQGEAANV